MQTLVEIGPSNDSQGQHRRKDAALAKRWKVQFRQGFAYFNNNVDSKRHIIIRTAILYNEINSGQIMKNTIYVHICI